jgi:hypothetical protein
MIQHLKKSLFVSISLCYCSVIFSQTKANDVTTPLHLLQPDYAVPYGAPPIDSVKNVLKRVYNYLNAVTPAQFVNRRTQEVLHSSADADTNTIIKTGEFRNVIGGRGYG